jgi:predicted lipoprotein with Yx(FWY)xxD motif
MPRRMLALTAAVALLGLAGCGDDDDEGGGDSSSAAATTTEAATAPASTTPPAAPGTTIKAGDSQFGQVLFDGDDRAVYYFDKEKLPNSECYGACAEAWPPVLTEGAPVAGDGAQAQRLGTTQRKDGSTQITYAGHPLYYYDEPPGTVTCHNVEEFGGLWLAVQPDGQAVPS